MVKEDKVNKLEKRRLEDAPILGKVLLLPARKDPDDSRDPNFSSQLHLETQEEYLDEMDDLMIALDIIRYGKKPYLAQLRKGLKKNENKDLKANIQHIISRIETGDFEQTPNDLLTEIELAKTEEQLEVIEFEIRQRKKNLFGDEFLLSENEYHNLQLKKLALRKQPLNQESREVAQILDDLAEREKKEIQDEIAELEEKEMLLAVKLYHKLGETEVQTTLLQLEMHVLNALQRKVEHHKERLEFKRTRNAFLSNLAFGIDALSSAADVLKFIPGFNFLFDAISTTLETTALMLESFAYDEDELIDSDLRQAMQEHLDAIRHFMRAELTSSITAIGLFGTGLTLPLLGLGFLAPPFFLAGAGMTLVANIIAIPRLNRAIEREELRSSIPGHENRLNALKAERNGRIYSVVGIVVLLAAAVLTVLFPPAGAFVIATIVLTAVATAFAAAAIKKEIDKKKFERAAEHEMQGNVKELRQKPKQSQEKELSNNEANMNLQKDAEVTKKMVSDLKHLKEDYQHLNEEHDDTKHKVSMVIKTNSPKAAQFLENFSKHVLAITEHQHDQDEHWHLTVTSTLPALSTSSSLDEDQNLWVHPKQKSITYIRENTEILIAYPEQNKLIFKIEDSQDYHKDNHGIPLMAINLISAGDLNPEIETGDPKDIIKLWEALKKYQSHIIPVFSKNVLDHVEASLTSEEKLEFHQMQKEIEQRKKERDNMAENIAPSPHHFMHDH